MRFEDYATYREITTQTRAWHQAIEITAAAPLPDVNKYSSVVFTGCGSTYYLSIAVAALFQRLTGKLSRAAPASELLFNSKSILPRARDSRSQSFPILLVAISRSGTTTETVKAVEQYKKANCGDVIVISNYLQTLSRLADYTLVIPEGQEISVAQTRSFASMYVAGCALSARMAQRDDLLPNFFKLPGIGERLIRDLDGYARNLGEDLSLEGFYFLGSGLQYGLACELSLKFKEMTLTQSEPFHFMEFRHGPMSMVSEVMGIVGLVSENNYSNEMKIVSEMRALSGRLYTFGESGTDVEFNSQLPEEIRAVLYLPVLQLIAFYRSLRKGLNPDTPKNLSAVVNLDL